MQTKIETNDAYNRCVDHQKSGKQVFEHLRRLDRRKSEAFGGAPSLSHCCSAWSRANALKLVPPNGI